MSSPATGHMPPAGTERSSWKQRWEHRQTFNTAIDSVAAMRQCFPTASDPAVAAKDMGEHKHELSEPPQGTAPDVRVRLSSSTASTKERSKTSYSVDLRAPAGPLTNVDSELPEQQRRVLYRLASMGLSQTRSQSASGVWEEGAKEASEEYMKLRVDLEAVAELDDDEDDEADEGLVQFEDGAGECPVHHDDADRYSLPVGVRRYSSTGISSTRLTRQRSLSSSGRGLQPTPPKGAASTHPLGPQQQSGPGGHGARASPFMIAELGEEEGAEMGRWGVVPAGRSGRLLRISTSGGAEDVGGARLDGRSSRSSRGLRSSLRGSGFQEEGLVRGRVQEAPPGSASGTTLPHTGVEAAAQSKGKLLSGMFKSLTKEFTSKVGLAYVRSKQGAAAAGSKAARTEASPAVSSVIESGRRRPHRTYSSTESDSGQSSFRPNLGRSSTQSDRPGSTSRPDSTVSSPRGDFFNSSLRPDLSQSSHMQSLLRSSPKPDLGRHSPRPDLTRRSTLSGTPSSLEAMPMPDAVTSSVTGQPDTPHPPATLYVGPSSQMGSTFGKRSAAAESMLQPSPPSVHKTPSRNSSSRSVVRRVVSHSKLGLVKERQKKEPLSAEASLLHEYRPLPPSPNAHGAGQGHASMWRADHRSSLTTGTIPFGVVGPVCVGPQAGGQAPVTGPPQSVWGGCVERLSSHHV